MSKGKEIVGLDCDANAAAGIRLLLHTRFDEMRSLRAEALDWSDIEGVHDMRVASRRLRSALRDIKPYLKRRKLRHAGDAIKSVADVLGAVRDKDVAIAALEELKESAPSEISVGIEMFARERRLLREDDRTALIAALEDDFVGLQTEFETALDSTFRSSPNGKSDGLVELTQVSFRAFGQMIVQSRTEELQSFSSSLYRPLSTKPLHRMRIAAKRLRYAVELFAPCCDSQIVASAREVAALQTSLGELHDCDVWIAEVGGLLQNLTKSGDPNGQIEKSEIDEQRRDAAVWLLSHFTKRRTAHYRNALARWHKWDTTDFFTRLVTSTQCLTTDGKLPRAASTKVTSESLR